MVVYKAASKPIEIAASPAVVREIFLDFPGWQNWHTGHFKSIQTHGNKKGSDLRSGDKMRVAMDGMTMNPTVYENTPSAFTWDGGVKGVLTGRHTFAFQPSKVTPGGTTFHNSEDFFGAVTGLFNFSSKTRQAGPGFDILNQDLKRKCESLA